MSRAITCRECDTICEQTGRNTWYCPDCDTCSVCGCPNADGFSHYAGCPSSVISDDEDDDAGE